MVALRAIDEIVKKFDKLPDELFHWFLAEGLSQLEAIFVHEFKVNLPKYSKGTIVPISYEKSISDYIKKSNNMTYYKANLWLFKYVSESIANKGLLSDNKYIESSILKNLIFEYEVLLEECSMMIMHVPGVFNHYKNFAHHFREIYWNACYLVYPSTVIPEPLFPLDSVVALLRSALENRIRSAFGLWSIEHNNDKWKPIHMREIFEWLKKVQLNGTLRFCIPLNDIERLYSWSNLYVHGSIKSYIWHYIYCLEYIGPLLIGGAIANGYSVDAGIKASINDMTLLKNIVHQAYPMCKLPQIDDYALIIE